MQRLIADDVDEAIEIATDEIEKSSVVSFYDAIGIDVLRLAGEEYLRSASAEHRLRGSVPLRRAPPSRLPFAGVGLGREGRDPFRSSF